MQQPTPEEQADNDARLLKNTQIEVGFATRTFGDDLAALADETKLYALEVDVEKLRMAFHVFDADGDGMVTKAEVIAALTRKTGHGTELSEEAAHATWQRWQAMFDANKDGKISYDELLDNDVALQDLKEEEWLAKNPDRLRERDRRLQS